MIVIILIFLIFTCSGVKLVKKNDQYLSKDFTNTIRGFFVFWVFFRHFLQYDINLSTQWYDKLAIKIDYRLAQLIVVMFLFYSGYGIMESIKSKGMDYINNLPKKRIFKTWLNFFIAVIIYLILNILLGINNYSIKYILLSFIGWESIGNSNWYIFAILMMYIFSYISFKRCKKNKNALILLTCFTGIYMVILYKLKDGLWYDTILCFNFGMLYSYFKQEIEKRIANKEIKLIAIFGIIFSGIIMSGLHTKNLIIDILNNLIFAFLVVLISRKIELNNSWLNYCGKNLFPIYIYMRIPMIIIDNLFDMNAYIFFIISLVSTIMITYIYNFLAKKINSYKIKI